MRPDLLPSSGQLVPQPCAPPESRLVRFGPPPHSQPKRGAVRAACWSAAEPHWARRSPWPTLPLRTTPPLPLEAPRPPTYLPSAPNKLFAAVRLCVNDGPPPSRAAKVRPFFLEMSAFALRRVSFITPEESPSACFLPNHPPTNDLNAIFAREFPWENFQSPHRGKETSSTGQRYITITPRVRQPGAVCLFRGIETAGGGRRLPVSVPPLFRSQSRPRRRRASLRLEHAGFRWRPAAAILRWALYSAAGGWQCEGSNFKNLPAASSPVYMRCKP